MNKMKVIKGLFLLVGVSFFVSSCGLIGGGGGKPNAQNPGQLSTATGLKYNDPDIQGSYPVPQYNEQHDAPNMVFIEGGRAVMGSFEEDVMSYRDNIERTVSVASFYMDETEIANIHWTEYLHYITIDSPRSSNPAVKDAYARALPDTLVWKGKLAFNDPYVEYYLRYPGFRYFPVVGIDWKQANEYARWRTLKVNDDLNKKYGNGQPPAGGTTLGITSGFQIPAYRLPTEAEWEYAAQALIGTQWLEELQTHQRIYPWDGHALRNPYGKQMGTFLANFKRGRGDYAGIAGRLNDGALITSYIYEYPPNDYGLYNMAGNVSEWVMDVYRPLSFQDFDDLNPIRRDEFLDDNNNYRNRWQKSKDSLKHDVYVPQNPESFLSLVSDKVRVYKGGSWKDVAYWMSPGTRRFLDEDSATATIGFRCAMIRAGSNR